MHCVFINFNDSFEISEEDNLIIISDYIDLMLYSIITKITYDKVNALKNFVINFHLIRRLLNCLYIHQYLSKQRFYKQCLCKKSENFILYKRLIFVYKYKFT